MTDFIFNLVVWAGAFLISRGAFLIDRSVGYVVTGAMLILYGIIMSSAKDKKS